jgi:hypothetical protein
MQPFGRMVGSSFMKALVPKMRRTPMLFLRLVVGMASIFGPVIVWLILLNRRDRRLSQLRLTVSEPLAAAELRGLIALQVRCAVFSGHSTVIVNTLACTPHEVWDIFTRVASRLPPCVRFLVHGAGGHQFAGPLTLETVTRGLSARRPQAPLVAG